MLSNRRSIYHNSDKDIDDQRWIQAAKREGIMDMKSAQSSTQVVELQGLGIYSEEYYEAHALFDPPFRHKVAYRLVTMSSEFQLHSQRNGYESYISYQGFRLTDDETVEYLAREVESYELGLAEAKGLLESARKIRKAS